MCDMLSGQILNFPVFATTQMRDKLGDTCSELGFGTASGITPKILLDKSAFSMWCALDSAICPGARD